MDAASSGKLPPTTRPPSSTSPSNALPVDSSVEFLELYSGSHAPSHQACDPPSSPTSPRLDRRRVSLHLNVESDTFPLLAAPSSLADELSYDEEDELQTPDQMPRRKAAKASSSPDPANGHHHPPSLSPSSPTDSRHENGHATGAMSTSLLEQRRKHASIDSTSTSRESHALHLLSRPSFSLDDPVPAPHDPPASSKGFSELPKQDRRNFLLLVLLYFLQGLPMGLAMGSVPFLLKQHVSYAQMGVFSLASYPYSLKLLWSPIIDAVWSPRLGRRKSWILPIQTLSGIGMIWLAGHVKDMIDNAGGNDGANVWGFTWWWFGLVFMCATQDIAVDGWALTLLSTENLSYASTAQTVGLTAGQFLTSTIFLAFNSKDFANKWFRTVPGDTGLVSLGGALATAGWLYLIVTVGLAVLKHEERTKNEDGIWDTYKVMGGILKLRNIQTLMIVHLIAKIGFQANDGATTLKLLDKGFGQDNLALTVLIDFPFEIGLGYYVGKWSTEYGAMRLWSWGFVGRLGAAVLAQFLVWVFPSGGVNSGYLLLVIFSHVYSTFMNTVMFVAVSAFHARIADPVYGGTYMTMLATVSNLGGTFPKFFVLKLIDFLTVAECIPPTNPPTDLKGPLVSSSFSCVAEADKNRCVNGGGKCMIEKDGYYVTNILCIIIGVVTFWGYIKPAVQKLQALPIRAWRLAE